MSLRQIMYLEIIPVPDHSALNVAWVASTSQQKGQIYVELGSSKPSPVASHTGKQDIVSALGPVALSELGPWEAPSSLLTVRLPVPCYSYNLFLERPSSSSFSESWYLPRLVGFKYKISQSRGYLLSWLVPCYCVSVLDIRLSSGFISSGVM